MSIANDLFSGCKFLNDTITKIGENAFKECTSLSKITIPSSVKSLEQNCFRGCTKLSEITMDIYEINNLKAFVFIKEFENLEVVKMIKNT